jgi:cation:H+ antiporter
VARDGAVDRTEGAAFLVALALFVAYTVRLARREVGAEEAGALAREVRERTIETDAEGGAGGDAGTPPSAPTGRAATPRPNVALALAVLALGVVALVVGGRLLVDGAVALARIAGLSERVIGLTVVAGGTGAPELATSLVAAVRRRADVAVANMIGSNIFNVLGILGTTALLVPVPVSPAIVRSDMWWMIGTAMLLLPIMHTGLRVGRLEGGVLLAIYVAYVTLLLGAG